MVQKIKSEFEPYNLTINMVNCPQNWYGPLYTRYVQDSTTKNLRVIDYRNQ